MNPLLGIADQQEIYINLVTLLRSRLLVQGASGAGKTWVLRRICEQTFNSIQQIVVDCEGDLRSLAEEFGYVVFSRGDGAAEISSETAFEIGARLFQRRIPALIDISDFDLDERRDIVNGLVQGMMRCSREYWHYCLVLIDEAHLFCPQQGDKETKKVRRTVIDLTARGRKRGLCPVLATQRLQKLHKDAAAELNNKLIGCTTLDVDVKRAAEELGVADGKAREMLEALEPGEFYTYGPAFSSRLVKTKVGPVKTNDSAQATLLVPPAPVTAENLKDTVATLLEGLDLPDDDDDDVGVPSGLPKEDTKGRLPDGVEKIMRRVIIEHFNDPEGSSFAAIMKDVNSACHALDFMTPSEPTIRQRFTKITGFESARVLRLAPVVRAERAGRHPEHAYIVAQAGG